MVTPSVPDLHHFRGSFGGADVIPLWKDRNANVPNVVGGLLDLLSAEFGGPVSAEDLFAYSYGLLSATDYVQRFSEELLVPGPRLPLTKNSRLFRQVVETGSKLVWLHTFGERMAPSGVKAGTIPTGAARCTKASDEYPERHSYDEGSRKLHVGAGVFAPVSPEVWKFSVSDMHVLGSWLDYRMKGGAGRRSSELDDIRPASWPSAFTEELLRVIRALEHTLDLMPTANAQFATVCAGATFAADELPSPKQEERRAPEETESEHPTLDLA
jgi:hypothetical protein